MPALQFFGEPLAHHAPVAKILGDAPKQPQAPVAEAVDITGRGLEERLGRSPRLAGQHQQELAAAARSQQNTGQTEVGEQRARQHFAKQGDPLRPAGQHVGRIFVGAGGRQQKLLDTQDFAL